MIKKRVYILIILLIILLIPTYILIEFPLQKKIAEESLYKYLEENGVSKDEIYAIKVFREIKTNKYKYNIFVTFKSEMKKYYHLNYHFSYTLSNGRLMIEDINFTNNTEVFTGGESIYFHKNIKPLFVKNYSNQSKLVLKYGLLDYIKDLFI